jgi:hypoxanthine phosphoribosyltransferase
VITSHIHRRRFCTPRSRLATIEIEASATAIQHNSKFVRIEGNRSWFGPALRTLRPTEFHAACAELTRMVEADYAPTLVLGIRTGGLTVAESMVRTASAPLPVLPVTCRRTATEAKSHLPLLRAALATLPRPAVDLLRRIEHRLFIVPRTHRVPSQHIDRREIELLAAWMAKRPRQARVLVTDDAVDSGATLATVLRHVREVCPSGAEIRTVVITQTLEEPIIRPDYALFHNVLCRFPWSFDAVA